MGSPSRQVNVVRPPLDERDVSNPLPTASRPSGTVIVIVEVALSRGLSLAGNQPGEPWGSPTTNAPSSVGTQPSMDLSGSVITDGTPAYSTRTAIAPPARTGAAGVMISSCPSRVKP